MNLVVCAIVLSAIPARQAELLGPAGQWVGGPARIEGGSVTVGSVSLALEHLIALRFASRVGAEWVEEAALLASGELLAGPIEALQAGELRMSSAALGKISLKRESLVAISLVRVHAMEFNSSGGSKSEEVVLTNGDVVGGSVEWINDETVGVNVGKRVLQVPRGRVAMIRFASGAPLGRVDVSRQFVSLSGGEVLAGRLHRLDGNILKMDSELAGPLELHSSGVSEVWSEGGPLVPLSLLKPVAERRTPLFDEQIPFRMDRSALGGVLSIAGIKYFRGIGCVPRHELVFDLGGAFSALVAEVGIDDSAGTCGSAIFRVLTDDKQVYESPPLRGGERPRLLKVGLAGCKRLTLVTDFAEPSTALQAHADWGRAVLVR